MRGRGYWNGTHSHIFQKPKSLILRNKIIPAVIGKSILRKYVGYFSRFSAHSSPKQRKHLTIREKPEVSPHKVLTNDQVVTLLPAKDRVLSSALLFGLLTGMRSGEICGLLASDVISKGNLGRLIRIQPNEVRQLKSKAAEREVPLHTKLEHLLDTSLPKQGRLFPTLTVDKVVKAYAKLRIIHPTLTGTVFHSTRKWFITQCERTGVPEHYTATLVGHHTARSSNKLTYALYSGGISDAQKREIVDGIRLPDWEGS